MNAFSDEDLDLMRRVEEDAARWLGDEEDEEAKSLSVWIDALGETLEKTEDPLLRRAMFSSFLRRAEEQKKSDNIEQEQEDAGSEDDEEQADEDANHASSVSPTYNLEEEMNDAFDEKDELEASYKEYCLKHGKTALLPVADVINALKVKTIKDLDCSNYSMGDSGATCMAAYLHHLLYLETLKLTGNNIHEAGMLALAKAFRDCEHLKAIVLDDNRIGIAGARALGDASVDKASSLEVLSVSNNKLTDPALAYVIKQLVACNRLKFLSIAMNSIGDASCDSLTKFCTKNRSLENLNCNWGYIRCKSAEEVANSLRWVSTLTHLDLGWNGFGDPLPCDAICAELRRKTCKIRFLNLSHNRVNPETSCMLASAIEANNSIKTIILDGNPMGKIGCRRMLKACHHAEDEGLEDHHARRTTRDKNEIQVSFKNCSFEHNQVTSQFNPSEPGGEYLLDMENPYSRLIVSDLLKIEARSKGQFVRHAMMMDGKPYVLPKWKDFDQEPFVPDLGELEFRFISLRKFAKATDKLPDSIFQRILLKFEDRGGASMTPEEKRHWLHNRYHLLRMASRIGKLEFFDLYMTSVTVCQARMLLSILQNTEDRIHFVATVYLKMNSTAAPRKLLNDLDDKERRLLESLLGPESYHFTPNNPTGHYRLDLSKHDEREVALRLQELRIDQDQVDQELFSTVSKHAGGSRNRIELVWRNTMHNGEPFKYKLHFSVPTSGVLELDFVELLKPQDKTDNLICISDEDWMAFLEHVKEVGPVKALIAFRLISNTELFLTHHVKELLCCFGKEAPETFRVEVCVIAFARTIDWHELFGASGLFRKTLSKTERRMLTQRLGAVNLFDHVMAVDYYELDASNEEDRWIMQEIVHFAVAEPGENCVNETWNGMDWETPKGWVQEAPKFGLYTVYYCRERETVEKVMAEANAKHPCSLENDIIPVGTSWVDDFMLHQIKEKLEETFLSAEDCFEQIDRDGGGTLDVKEFATGLVQVLWIDFDLPALTWTQLGIWLRPHELRGFFSKIDQDGSGQVDLDELQEFWQEY
ncbi:hypothetical protein GUITHDRAFT_103928 [Guillardia theta CCMP2712]|uniref:EF-hand domain-containing protein n=1 Tax=Guillardia theta (strain CCMP2712) TaxID=905079 RepID=L1JPJ1_GUITC|nr:hypothetical protein GUITHDRAFT_103928 [Guillardia theta CCMP2712]EKX50115.1 hypothetical protein GUITHDRAFT_103928 [Guillardia theta CCMP2712]|eukprot:XP_005837095.1 hypothetical protein GUITHDRAFT_103928 [Guillardia theta CCMP2712]